MDRFNSNEDFYLTPLQIAKQLVFSDDYDDRSKLTDLIAKEIENAYNSGYEEGAKEAANDILG